MSPQDVGERVHAHFRDRYGLTDAELATDPPLETFIDSLGRLTLIELLRVELGIPLENHEINPTNLGSPARIIAYVRTKLNASTEAP